MNYAYAYNGLGKRLRQTVGTTTTAYVIDSSSGLSQVLTDGTNTYLYGLERISQTSAGGKNYFSGVVFHTYRSDTKIPLINFLRETGHMIDYSKNNGYSNPLKNTPTWVKDGYVNRELLGDMFRQPVQALPMGEAYQPTEYWADAFGNFAADNILLKEQDPTGNGQKMYDYVYGVLNN